MDYPPIVKGLIGLTLAVLLMYWTVIRGNRLAAQQKARNDLKKRDAESHEDIVDHVTIEMIQGMWQMVSLGRNGNFAPKEVLENAGFFVVIVGNTMTQTNTLQMSTIEINNNIVPNQLDQIDEDGDKHLCIVRMRNNQLEMCQAEVGKPRPLNFNRKRRDGASLVMFKQLETEKDAQATD